MFINPLQRNMDTGEAAAIVALVSGVLTYFGIAIDPAVINAAVSGTFAIIALSCRHLVVVLAPPKERRNRLSLSLRHGGSRSGAFFMSHTAIKGLPPPESNASRRLRLVSISLPSFAKPVFTTFLYEAS
jgi:hypothetical protein